MGWSRQVSNIRRNDIHLLKERNRNYTSGVGLLLSPAAGRALESYECISDRLLTAKLNCGIIRMIIVCCSPTDVAEIEGEDRLYQSFEGVLQRLHSHDLQLVVGDFNARVGTDRNGFELFLGPQAVAESAKDNGQRLLDTCASNNFVVIGGSLFPHKSIHWTVALTWVQILAVIMSLLWLSLG